MKSVQDALEAVRRRLPEIRFRTDEPLKAHTSFKIGGPVSVMFFPKSTAELRDLGRILYDSGCRFLVIGNGTNILADDKPIDMIAVKTHGGLGSIRLTGETELTAECGALLSKLTAAALEHGLTGLEFAHGIPGTLGGAVAMNAGAYGGEMKDVIVKTTAFGRWSSVYEVRREDHGFFYRRSRFSDSDDIILSSVIRLKKGDPKDIRRKMEELSRKRRESQPLNIPSAGSAFKRPKGGYAAALIQEAGLKGFTAGGAAVSEKHAGFIINKGSATFKDVMTVIDHVREEVLRQFGITLEPEIKIIRSNI